MNNVMDHPALVFALSLLALWLSAWAASFVRSKWALDKEVLDDFGTVVAATLTLSGLIIGFSFQMAINRYDSRKSREAEEANAIGTEYARAGLLPAADTAKVRVLLRHYLEQRISFYTAADDREVLQVDARTASLQAELWAEVTGAADAHPTPIVGLATAGMNDVMNSQGYTQAAWWNRIPLEAWLLMALIGVIGNFLVVYTARHRKNVLLLVLPVVLSVSWVLIAEIDSPRSGFIRVQPQNLQSLLESLRAGG
jgi:hypothetical protein